MQGFKLMYSHRTKPVAIAISAIGVAGMLLERLHPLILVPKWDARQHYMAFVWIALGGLFGLAYCKEKFDDERAQQIRLKSMQIAFMLLAGSMLSIAFMHEVARVPDLVLEGAMLYALAGFAIVFYLLSFYLGLYFDRYWDYDNTDKSIWQNLKDMPKNIGGVLLYLLIGAAAMLVMFLLTL